MGGRSLDWRKVSGAILLIVAVTLVGWGIFQNVGEQYPTLESRVASVEADDATPDRTTPRGKPVGKDSSVKTWTGVKIGDERPTDCRPVGTGRGGVLYLECSNAKSLKPFLKVDAALAELVRGRAAIFADRSEMEVGDAAQVAVTVAVNATADQLTNQLKKLLQLQDADVHNVVLKDTKIAPTMIARLSGSGFKISPEGDQISVVSGTRPTSWTWSVEALDGDDLGYHLSANRKLHVALFADVEVGKLEHPWFVETLEHDISIKVGPLQWFSHTEKLAEEFWWVGAAIVSAVGGLGLFRWRRHEVNT